jgi:uncharacterized LabA/DUF88 family protein
MADRIMVFVDHSNLAWVVRSGPFYKTVSHVHYQNLLRVLSRGNTAANCQLVRTKRAAWAFIYVPDEGIIDDYRRQLVRGLAEIDGVFHRGGVICSDTVRCRSQVRETQTKSGWRDCATECKSISEKMIDVALATDMVRFACKNEYETAFLVSQDRDFIPAVEAVRAEGKKVIHAFVRKSALSGQCNSFRNISTVF